MKKIVIGILLGAILTVVVTLQIMPRLMVSEMQSPLGYEETITHIRQKAEEAGWKVSALMRLDKSLAKEGKSVLPAVSMKLCQPDHAETVLQDDDARFLSVMMPCSIAVYEKSDGKTYISTLNTALMGKLFGGTAAEVMAGPVAEETAGFTEF